jgi:hypothetical protein
MLIYAASFTACVHHQPVSVSMGGDELGCCEVMHALVWQGHWQGAVHLSFLVAAVSQGYQGF